MNPIIQIIADAHESGEKVVRVSPDNHIKPKGIVIQFESGEQQSYPIDVPDLASFMVMWKQASVWSHIQWEKWERIV